MERDAFLKSASLRGRAVRTAAGLAAAWAFASLSAAPAPAQDLESAVQESYATNLVLLREATRASVAELFIGFSAPAGETLLVEPDGGHPANWYVENHLLSHLSQAGYQAYLKEASARPQPAAKEAGKDAGEDAGAASAEGQGPRARRQQQQEQTSLADAMNEAEDSTLTGGSAGESGEDPAAGSPAGSPPETGPAAGDGGHHPDYILRYRVLHFEISYPKNYRTSPLGSRKVQRRVSVSLVASLLRGERENVVWVGDGAVERLDVVPAGKLALLEGSDFPFTQPTLETRGLGSLVEPALVSGIVLGLVYLFYTNQD